MPDLTHTTTETAAGMAAKASAPITVSLASVAGYQVSELLLWSTLIYTILMIAHKLYNIYKDVTSKQS
jgi:hypothetical protein